MAGKKAAKKTTKKTPKTKTASKKTTKSKTITATQFDTLQSQQIDLDMIVNASQAIMGELNLDTLIRQLLEMVSESAGAESTVILLAENDHFIPYAKYIENKTIFYDEKTYSDDVPDQVVRYVGRTRRFCII